MLVGDKNMNYSQYRNIRISAIAAAVSENVQKIEDLKSTVDSDVIDKFIKKTGITEIRKSGFDQTASDFGYGAVKRIEEAGKFTPEEIGVLVYITQTPDYRTPSTAYALHKRLGLSKDCAAFDVNLGCSGFVYGVGICSSMLQLSNATKGLVIVGDTLARHRLNDSTQSGKQSSNTHLLFGDASAAILLEKCDGSTIYSALMSDGTGHKALSNPYGAWKHPVGPESYPGDDIAVFNFAISEVPSLLKGFMGKISTEAADYDALILHQANMMIMKQIARKVKIPMEKVPVSLDRFGNTSGASIPLTIVDKYGNSKEGRDLKMLASGFGVGLSWGAVSFDINENDIYPLVVCKDTYDDGYPDE